MLNNTNEHIRHFRYFLLGTIISGSFLSIGLLLYGSYVASTVVPVPPVHHTAQAATNAFMDIRLGAKAAFVWDIRANKVLYANNEEMVRPLASLTKLMTALVAEEELSPNTSIAITSRSLLPEGDSGFLAGEHWKFSKLRDFMLIASSNDAAHALAAAVVLSAATTTDASTTGESAGDVYQNFVMRMNERAQQIGMQKTIYRNESGLDLDRATSGANGSAKDIAMLFAYIFKNHPEIFEITTQRSATLASTDGHSLTARNTDIEVNDIPGLRASKTGLTDLAGGNLGIIFDAGPAHPIVVVVLGSTEKGRFDDVKKLAKAALEEVTQ